MVQAARVLRRSLVALIISLINCNHHTTSAILVNRTIDDQFGDPITGTYPTYSPAEDWRPGANCSDCSVRPDVTKAFDGTWHDSTYYPGDAPRTVTVTFSGTLYFSEDSICLILVLRRECGVRLLHNPARPECDRDDSNIPKFHA
jgi:hypothetical protein